MSSLVTPSAFATEDVRRTVFDNGLVVLCKEVHTSPIVTAMIWYRVGSRKEELGHTGKSHFLEHMLFKGTDRFKKGEIDLITLKNGGGNNAFTSHDFTAYYFNFASDRWDIALEIEADRMVNCSFEPDEFEAEKKVVIEELRPGSTHPGVFFCRNWKRLPTRFIPIEIRLWVGSRTWNARQWSSNRRTTGSTTNRIMPSWLSPATSIPIACWPMYCARSAPFPLVCRRSRCCLRNLHNAAKDGWWSGGALRCRGWPLRITHPRSRSRTAMRFRCSRLFWPKEKHRASIRGWSNASSR